MKADRKPIKAEGLLDRELGDDIVVLSPDGKVLHTFAGTARFIWTRIDGARSFDDLVVAMTDEYQVDRATASEDITAFLADLAKLGLVAEGE